MSNFSDDMFIEGEDLTMVDSKRIAITMMFSKFSTTKRLRTVTINNSQNNSL